MSNNISASEMQLIPRRFCAYGHIFIIMSCYSPTVPALPLSISNITLASVCTILNSTTMSYNLTSPILYIYTILSTTPMNHDTVQQSTPSIYNTTQASIHIILTLQSCQTICHTTLFKKKPSAVECGGILYSGTYLCASVCAGKT